uniref:Venom protein family 2 protein 14 n=1 Tax=Lethocerus distinctifemur TaxID=280095 RepID=A0A2K8JW55_9HEMI|nr:venom protein family 2 protein 14 [Lethocerus distinctifemur]
MKISRNYIFLLAFVALARVSEGHPAPQEDGDDGDNDESARWGKLITTGVKETMKEGAKKGIKTGVAEGVELGMKKGIKVGISSGIKTGFKSATKGLKVVGKKAVSSKTAKMISTGAIKVGKSKVVKSGKKFVIKLGKEVASSALEAAGELATEAALEALKGATESEREIDIMEYLDAADICGCEDNQHCACCAEIGDYPKACVDILLRKSLWNSNSKVDVKATYGPTTVLEDKFPVDKIYEKCTEFVFAGTKVEFCIMSRRTNRVNSVQVKCFEMSFNDKTLEKCFQQNKDMELEFYEE